MAKPSSRKASCNVKDAALVNEAKMSLSVRNDGFRTDSTRQIASRISIRRKFVGRARSQAVLVYGFVYPSPTTKKREDQPAAVC